METTFGSDGMLDSPSSSPIMHSHPLPVPEARDAFLTPPSTPAPQSHRLVDLWVNGAMFDPPFTPMRGLDAAYEAFSDLFPLLDIRAEVHLAEPRTIDPAQLLLPKPMSIVPLEPPAWPPSPRHVSSKCPQTYLAAPMLQAAVAANAEEITAEAAAGDFNVLLRKSEPTIAPCSAMDTPAGAVGPSRANGARDNEDNADHDGPDDDGSDMSAEAVASDGSDDEEPVQPHRSVPVPTMRTSMPSQLKVPTRRSTRRSSAPYSIPGPSAGGDTDDRAHLRFACSVCSRRFLRNHERDRHEYTHLPHEVTKIVCGVCNGEIKGRQSSMVRHRRERESCIAKQVGMSDAELVALGCFTAAEREAHLAKKAKKAKSKGVSKRARLTNKRAKRGGK